MDWKPLLASITGSVDEALLRRHEYLATENRILRQQLTGRVQLTDAERRSLAEIGKKLGKKALEEVATLVKPETILAWHRTLVVQKFDGSQPRKALGRPRIAQALEDLVVRLAQENRSWGYDRIVGALKHVGYTISDQTVGTMLKRHGVPPAPKRTRTTTWQEFIRTHLDVLVATDFFTTEVRTWCGRVTYSILFCIRISTREVHVAGLTPHPDQRWMTQIARHVTMADWGFLASGQYLIHDRDTKFCMAFQATMDAAGMTRVVLPPRSPNLNAYAARWVRSVKEERLSRLILVGERSLRSALSAYGSHDHHGRPYQGKGHVVLMPVAEHSQRCEGPIFCQERLGGLLKYDDRAAA
jgi:putative transposase